MRKEVLQKFFENRGIDIPDLNIDKWRELVDGGPTSARFAVDWDGRSHYYSGTGNTHLSFLVKEEQDEVDVRLERDWHQLGEDPHDYKIMWEFIRAGLDKSSLNEVMGYNRSITQKDIFKALRVGWNLRS